MSRASTDSRLAPLLADYTVPDGHFDELLDENRAPRRVWDEFAVHAGPLTAEHLSRAQARVDRQIHENGVTFNVYASADGPTRPWTLDVLPLLVSATDWNALVPALRQRAQLLNAVAADLYGRRDLLAERLLPPNLILQHPGFLRPCDGASPGGGVFLHLLAFDLARQSDGQWVVVDTRTQSPSGAGYALENRATVSRLFPDALRALRVHALGAFFQGLRRTLIETAPAQGQQPHIVLLTPGPFNETYFEHAFLAKQLGFPLVEGGDLTVRRDRVFLKTVSGLRAVHAILRRLDDDYCDPVELRADSTLGVPGLLQAWRAGHVLVANAFGTGVLEAPALGSHLPRICERLLGQPMLSLSAPADSRPMWSHVPVWHNALASRAMMLRVFLASDGTGGYRVMPGGLARIAGDSAGVVSSQRGGGSKDTWVVSDGVPEVAAGLGQAHTRRAGDDSRAMTSSRAAEHLFWLGRYAERAENVARLLRSVLSRLADAEAFPSQVRQVILGFCRAQGLLGADEQDELEQALATPTAVERVLVEAMQDAVDHHSLAFNVAQTVRAASTVRDRLSTDNWRLLNRLHQALTTLDADGLELDEALNLIDQAIVSLVAVGGLEMAHMTRDDGWRFLSIGRHLERLAFTSASLEAVSRSRRTNEPALLEWLLDLSDSLVTYRARHMHQPEWPPVVDLLLFDPHNPRSGVFQLGKLAKHVRVLPGAESGDLAALVRDTERLTQTVLPVNASQGELFGHAAAVDDALARGAQLAMRLSDALALRYFSHVYELPRAMA